MTDQQTVADLIASFLAREQVPAVFEMSGGMIARLLDSIHTHGITRIVSVHHEQTAAFAACATGAMTGRPGVALATSGPGATNLLTGIGAAFFDSQPAVFITGQVNRGELKGAVPIRQLGFQETDIVAMARPITKAAWQVNEPDDVIPRLQEAFRLAMQGRPGPVLLDIPLDVQGSVARTPAWAAVGDVTREPAAEDAIEDAIAELMAELASASRPLILVGGGVRSSGAVGALHSALERLEIPVVLSLHGIDALPFDHPLRVGMIGSYGNRWANEALARADLLVVLGSRLDIRQTGADTVSFKGDRPIFHVDCEEAEINHRVLGCRPVVADVKAFLDALVASHPPRMAWPEWLSSVAERRRRWPDTAELSVPGINPNEFMHALSSVSKRAGVYVADVGQHQMWAAQSLDIRDHQRFLTSGGMGAMGSGLPLAIGAAIVKNEATVLVVGDGSFQTNIQELETVRRNTLPIKIVVINNRCHGMVRQFQESYFGGRYQSTLWGYSTPSFVAVAQAYGIEARAVADRSEVAESLAWLWQDPASPAVLEVAIDTYANVYPKIAFGKPISEMEPFATPVAMEGT